MHNDETQRSPDHDLLIELKTKFSSFEVASNRMWQDVNDKMSRILLQMESKADKQDLQFIKQTIEKIESRVQTLEQARALDATRKETVINLGNVGLKTWGFIAGLIMFILSIIQMMRGK